MITESIVAVVDFLHPYIILNIQGWVEEASSTIISMMDAVKLPHQNIFWLIPPLGYNRVDGGLASRRHLKIISEIWWPRISRQPTLRDSFTYQLPACLYLLYPVSFPLSPVSYEVPGAKRFKACFAKWDQLSANSNNLIPNRLLPNSFSPFTIHNSPNTKFPPT